jgi:tripartite-type tricarboxylate transporter receptor subunit TctC
MSYKGMQMGNAEVGVLRGLAATFAATALFFAGSALAETFPDKPLRLVVPWAPGGNIDPVARVTAAQLGEALGQQVVVENKPGAAGWIGTQFVARAAPDGYTLLLSSSGLFTIAPLLYPPERIGFDPIKSFDSIGGAAVVPMVLVVGPSVKAQTIKELVEEARTRPGGLKAGTAGNGTSSHLITAMFEQESKAEVTLVPYKAGTQVAQDMLAGNVDIAFDQIPSSLSLVRSGKLRALAVLSPERSSMLPNVPTTTEAGLPRLQAMSFYGISAPAGTPPETLKVLRDAMAKVLRERETKAGLERVNTQPIEAGAESYTRMIVDDLALWKKVIAESHITPSEH